MCLSTHPTPEIIYTLYTVYCGRNVQTRFGLTGQIFHQYQSRFVNQNRLTKKGEEKKLRRKKEKEIEKDGREGDTKRRKRGEGGRKKEDD
jgi:hypothetical protein